MNSLTLLLLTLFFLSLQLCSATPLSKNIPYNDPNILIYGRSYTDGQGLRYDWPCTTIQFCFVNTSRVWWLGSDSFSHYSVILNDNQTTSLIPHKGTNVSIYQGKQTPNLNCLKITKITEDHFGPLGTRTDAIFKGLELEGSTAQLVHKDKPYKYKLQFVGDSLTVGYGDLSGTNIKCFFRMRHNENCLESWASHLSRRLNAEYRIIAESGKGVVKNAPFIFGKTMMSLFFKNSSNSKPESYSYQDKYNPNVVLVFLGVNDYNNLIKPGEKNFIFGYEKMLTQIVNLQIASTGNKPKIIGLCSADFSYEICVNVKKAIQSFNYAYNKAYYLQVPQGIFVKGNMGCINHPNVAGQKKIADALYDRVKSILES